LPTASGYKAKAELIANEGTSLMLNRFLAPRIVLIAWIFSLPALAQDAQGPPRIPFPAPDPGAPPVDRSQDKHLDGWYKDSPILPADPKAAPASRHDLSGIWEPAAGWLAGVQFMGAQKYPSDGKHSLPFTPEGENAFKTHKAGFGTNEVPIALNNDPFDICDPIGFPRIELFNLRAIQILQTPKQVMIFYQNDRTFRSIWTDGRAFPDSDIAEPRWYGYSIGKWEDDTTFVVETTGLDERTWIDNVGRPHSSDLRVEERFHRVNHDILELTLTIIDPKMYTKPWNALNKFPLRLQPADFDLREMICSPSEQAEFDKQVSRPAIANSRKK
jgi:hypothetical protein